MTKFCSDMCIICFAPKRFHSQWLFSPSTDDSNGEIEISEIGLLFQELLQISLSFTEPRPQYVCQLCKEQLHKFHKFKLKAWEAHQKVSNEIYDNNAVEEHDRSSSSSKDNNVKKVEEVTVFDISTKQTEKYEIQYLDDQQAEVDADDGDTVELIEIDENKAELWEESDLQDRDDGNLDQSISSSNNSTSPLQQSIQHITRIACPVCSSFFDNQEDFEMHFKEHEIRRGKTTVKKKHLWAPRCELKSCRANKLANPHLKFFRFPPRESILYQKWFKACCLTKPPNTKTAYLCSRHFPPEHIGRIKLKKNVVPSCNILADDDFIDLSES